MMFSVGPLEGIKITIDSTTPFDHGNDFSAIASLRASKRDNGVGPHDKASKASRRAFHSSGNENYQVGEISKWDQKKWRSLSSPTESDPAKTLTKRRDHDEINQDRIIRKMQLEAARKTKKHWQIMRGVSRDAKYSYTQYSLNDPDMDVVFPSFGRADDISHANPKLQPCKSFNWSEEESDWSEEESYFEFLPVGYRPEDDFTLDLRKGR